MKLHFVICKIPAFALLLLGSGIVIVTKAQTKDSSANGSYKYNPSSSVSKGAERSSKKSPINMPTPKPTKYLRKGDRNVSPSGISGVVMKKKVVIVVNGNSTVISGENDSIATSIEEKSKTGSLGYYKVKGAKINLSKQSDRSKNPLNNNTEIISSPSPANALQVKGSSLTENGDTLPPPFQENGNDDNLSKSKNSPSPSKESKNILNRSSENYENGTVALVAPKLNSGAYDNTIIKSPAPQKAYASEKGPLLETKQTFRPTNYKKSKDDNDTTSIRSPAPSKQLKNSITTLQRDYQNFEDLSIAVHINQPNELANETEIITPPSPAKANFGKEESIVEAWSSIQPSSEKKTKDISSKYTPSPSKQFNGDNLQRSSGNNEPETFSFKILQPEALTNDTVATTSPSPAKSNFAKKNAAIEAWSSTRPVSEKDTPSPSKDSKVSSKTIERDYSNVENKTIQLEIPTTKFLKNDGVSTTPPHDAQEVNNLDTETEESTMAQPNGLHDKALPTISPSPAVAPLRKKGFSPKENTQNGLTFEKESPVANTTDSAPPLEPSDLEVSNRTILPSFPQPKEIDGYSSITASPTTPTVIKDKKEATENETSFVETHEATMAEDSVPDVSSKLGMKDTLEDSTLTASGSGEPFNASEVSRLPSKSSKSDGTNVASTHKGAEKDEHFSYSYQYASTAPPTKSQKSSKKVHGANSISPTSVEVIDENYSLSYLYGPTAAPTKGKKVSLSLQPSGSHSHLVLPTSAGNITFTYYEDTTLAPLPVLSSQENSSRYIGNETLNYNNYDNVTGEGNSESKYARSSIVPNTEDVITSIKPGNIDPMISLSSTSSSIDDENESASYTKPPLLDTLATMKRPQEKGSRDWK